MKDVMSCGVIEYVGHNRGVWKKNILPTPNNWKKCDREEKGKLQLSYKTRDLQ